MAIIDCGSQLQHFIGRCFVAILIFLSVNGRLTDKLSVKIDFENPLLLDLIQNATYELLASDERRKLRELDQ